MRTTRGGPKLRGATAALVLAAVWGSPAAAPADEKKKQGSAIEEPRGDAPDRDKALAARAAELKRTGDAAMDSLRYADALDAYADAHAISADPALLYNMGRALQALDRTPEALARLEAFEVNAPDALKRRVAALPELIAQLKQQVSTATIRVSAEGARILVRGVVVGRSPLPSPLVLRAGPARIEIEADGYFPYRETAELPGGGAVALEAKLLSRATTGILAVRASAPGSEVAVDGRRAGVAPVELAVAGGAHTVSVKNADYAPFETSAVVSVGERKDLDVRLLPPSVVTRWWFWTVIGAGIAGAAAITGAALTERAPSQGTIPPGQLKTPASMRVGATIRVSF